jgi:hypothetical protein
MQVVVGAALFDKLIGESVGGSIVTLSVSKGEIGETA